MSPQVWAYPKLLQYRLTVLRAPIRPGVVPGSTSTCMAVRRLKRSESRHGGLWGLNRDRKLRGWFRNLLGRGKRGILHLHSEGVNRRVCDRGCGMRLVDWNACDLIGHA